MVCKVYFRKRLGRNLKITISLPHFPLLLDNYRFVLSLPYLLLSPDSKNRQLVKSPTLENSGHALLNIFFTNSYREKYCYIFFINMKKLKAIGKLENKSADVF